MSIPALARITRSYRRFNERFSTTPEFLSEWIEAARVTASARNLQPLKYRLVTDRAECAQVFDCCAWAGYLTDWEGPAEGERPTGYIVMCNDTTLGKTESAKIDAGIAAQTIMLCASENGYGGTIIMSFNKQKVINILGIPEHLEPMLVLALGKPKEDVRLTEMIDGDYRYYRNENGTHFVPKRSLEEIII